MGKKIMEKYRAVFIIFSLWFCAKIYDNSVLYQQSSQLSRKN